MQSNKNFTSLISQPVREFYQRARKISQSDKASFSQYIQLKIMDH